MKKSLIFSLSLLSSLQLFGAVPVINLISGTNITILTTNRVGGGVDVQINSGTLALNPGETTDTNLLAPLIIGIEGDSSYTLDKTGSQSVAIAYDEFNDTTNNTHHTLRAGTKQSTGVIMESIVRRLTPLECERLQGFPDDWTVTQSDSQRYKQMGNAVAVPVVEWVIQNICDIV